MATYTTSIMNIIQDRINHLTMILKENENCSMYCSDGVEDVESEIKALEKCMDILVELN